MALFSRGVLLTRVRNLVQETLATKGVDKATAVELEFLEAKLRELQEPLEQEINDFMARRYKTHNDDALRRRTGLSGVWMNRRYGRMPPNAA